MTFKIVKNKHMKQNKSYAVFFDLDKTLLTINSGTLLFTEAYKAGLISSFTILKALILSVIFKLRLKSTEKITKLMAKQLEGIAEISLEKLAKQITENKLVHSLRSSMIKEIEYHKKQGASVVMLSAALCYICKPLSKHLGMNDVICSEMEVKQGIFTGKPKDEICIGKEKEIKAREYCAEKLYNLKETYCYGDSYTDRFVLQLAGSPVCVAPDKRLRKLSEVRHWTVIND